MKKILIPALAVMLAATACNKNTDPKCEPVTTKAPDSEIATLRAYISGAGITATEDSRGFFYRIDRVDTAAKMPSSCSSVTVDYVGKLTNGTQFDAGNRVTFSLSGLITGWQEGIPLIGEGGAITLWLPPSLAYGNRANGSIPANSILVFNISLLMVN